MTHHTEKLFTALGPILQSTSIRVREAPAYFIRTMGAHGVLEKSASRLLTDFLVHQCTLTLDSTEEAGGRRTMELEVRQLCSSTLQSLGDSPRMANVLWLRLLLQLSPAAHGPALPLLLQTSVGVDAGRRQAALGQEVRQGEQRVSVKPQGHSTPGAAGAQCIFVYDGADHKTCFCQKEWEQQLLQFLEDLLFFISDLPGWAVSLLVSGASWLTVISGPVTRSVCPGRNWGSVPSSEQQSLLRGSLGPVKQTPIASGLCACQAVPNASSMMVSLSQSFLYKCWGTVLMFSPAESIKPQLWLLVEMVDF
ncbi:uncharacterized protein LOC120368631 [Mauremys reevesii]|uniref:uncharacterized protein LOC120368631 n=1 Tax=Mauremys reevesii TaxID=260615 RepID=UPI00193F220E|nr:uncharacterized protein LOC120368631 [Mauremys reevesii]